ncbi:unnamed protein product [Musa acuminata subsp. malaccensis]|nr:unnamed protein product [Musa acuminata subsp. malaccensis]
MEITYATSSNLDLADGVVGMDMAAWEVRSERPWPSLHSSSAPPVSRWWSSLKAMTATEWLEMLLPCTRWICRYRSGDYLELDLTAGVTVGVMLVPQAMSYAKLAGLHPIYGLYSGFVPIFVYAVFGSSRQLAIGPVTLVSLLVSNVLGGIVDPSDELYTELAILLAFMVGVLECLLGLLRLGWLLRFISHSVISGFISSSAIIIALSQAKYFLGYDIVQSSRIFPLTESIIAGASDFSWSPFLMGSVILTLITLMKHLGKTKKNLRFLRSSGPLTAVVLGTAFVKSFHPSSISVVGEIPQGLPTFHIPREFQHLKSLISTAFLITGVAILESVGIAKALAAKNGYELDPNQELFGLGMANICGSFFSAYPATGSFSRSAVNNESGAQTGLSGIITGLTIGCALLFLTPWFRDIPQCALAAIVVSVGISLVDYEKAMFLWQVDKKDFLLWMLTCLATLFLGTEIGVLVGVFSSLAFVIHESANPCIAILGRLPGTTIYRNIDQYPEACLYRGIVVIRIEAPIYFANISYLKDRLREFELVISKNRKWEPQASRIHFVIIEMASVPYIDSSAVEALKDLHQEYKLHEVQIAISNPNQKVLMTLARSHLIELIGKSWFFVSVHDAVKACIQQAPNLMGTSPGGRRDATQTSQPDLVQKLWKQEDESAVEWEYLLPQEEET